jgi:DNA-binding CsgD family transcriptional regulator/tetratricopeptide (TPR) repeat protein
MGARERAYRAYRADADTLSAARMAIWLASDHLDFRGADTIAKGWIERARRMLDDMDPSAEHGWLLLHEADIALRVKSANLETVARLSLEAAELGRELGVPDLETVGLGQAGVALVAQGKVEEGMRRIDAATSLALAEEFELALSPGWALCSAVSASEGVGDFPKAAQFCGSMRQMVDLWGGRHFAGVCRSAYGNVLATGGDWDGAEDELVAAAGDLKAARPAMAGGSLARLGALRARQGRIEEAREHFREAGAHPMAQVGLGELALAEGDAAGAADIAERVLRNIVDDALLTRLPAYELLALARNAQGDPEAARAAAEHLVEGAQELGTGYLLGRASAVAARLDATAGSAENARRRCEDAIDLFHRASAPYEEAKARLILAEILLGLGRDDAARVELGAAREAFEALGATADAEAAAKPLSPGADFGGETRAAAARPGGASGSAGAASDLSPRELEVLRLVAQGLSDADIAERLVVSPHTVHRHVANIRSKLRLSSRTAAVAYATREGLL